MKEFDKLLTIIKTLRSPQGCPWDRVQTIENMRQYLLEEVYELQDAINCRKKLSIREELGDIFLILIVLCEMFRQSGAFDVKDVLQAIAKKLVSRHPHVFSTKKLHTKDEVLSYWIKTKAKKKNRKSIKCRLPQSAPSLILASLFFKELKHLKPEALSLDDAPLILSWLDDSLAKLRKRSLRKKAFSEALFHLARFAYISGIDLEALLRQKVFREAEGVTYSHRKKS